MISSRYNQHPVHLIESVGEFDFVKNSFDPKSDCRVRHGNHGFVL